MHRDAGCLQAPAIQVCHPDHHHPGVAEIWEDRPDLTGAVARRDALLARPRDENLAGPDRRDVLDIHRDLDPDALADADLGRARHQGAVPDLAHHRDEALLGLQDPPLLDAAQSVGRAADAVAHLDADPSGALNLELPVLARHQMERALPVVLGAAALPADVARALRPVLQENLRPVQAHSVLPDARLAERQVLLELPARHPALQAAVPSA